MSETAKVPTTREALDQLAEDQVAAFDELLDHCNLQYDDANADSGGVVLVGWNPTRWSELPAEAQRYVGQAKQAYNRFAELGSRAVEASASDRSKSFERAGNVLERVIAQDGSFSGAPADSIDGIREVVRRAVAKQLEVIEHLPSSHGDGGQFLVPDTNALLAKPDLELWSPPAGQWTVVLVPQVVRELDALKQREHLREKATGVIRRVKEYARRSDTFSGVPIADRLTLQEVAIDPEMDKAPSWLRSEQPDDQLLASVLELAWADLQARVVLATRDRNLQNKARFARVSYLDVDDDL